MSLLWTISSHAQWEMWTGDTEKFQVNESQLQLKAPKDASPAQLRTASTRAFNSFWEFNVKMKFNPTSKNYAKIFLCSDAENLTGSLHGLYLRIGYTKKNVALISQTGTTVKTLFEGLENRLDKEVVSLSVRVYLDYKGTFTLYTKLEGENDYLCEGTVDLSDTYTSQYLGLVCYYTSTNNENFYFDKVKIEQLADDDEIPDLEAMQADSLDAVINEILYDPNTGGDEYVELYNRSDKTLDLSMLGIATRKSDGTLNKIYPLASQAILLSPGEFLLITHLKENVCSFYSCAPSAIYAELPVMPALANTGSTIVILNTKKNKIVDEFTYTDKLHVKGLSVTKGVSLERIDYEKTTNRTDNWTSASSDVGYGTPGAVNSQHQKTPGGEVVTAITTDGKCEIKYRFTSQDNKCRIFIYDSSGRLVSTMLNNDLLGMEGRLYWDTKASSGEQLKSGVYIISMEIYQYDGNVRKFKIPVALKNK